MVHYDSTLLEMYMYVYLERTEHEQRMQVIATENADVSVRT